MKMKWWGWIGIGVILWRGLFMFSQVEGYFQTLFRTTGLQSPVTSGIPTLYLDYVLTCWITSVLLVIAGLLIWLSARERN